MVSSVFDIRSEFIKYFVEKGHENVQSSSLVPDNDPTLMFTNSGMVQFKDVFTGKKTLPYSRATTAQKSLRAGGKHNDLDNVGYTARHHTFFEMLGNFSFGDYFKEEAITFAWELITKRLGLAKDKLLVTVHTSDEEAASFWKKIAGLDDSRIIRIPTNDNFWSMGDTGPCGPCSEIFYDHGPEIAGGMPGTPEQDGDRFIEIWNLVFMQFETLADGSRITLPKPSIDTGMGLERIAAVLQGVHNNYDIDLFKTIINDIKSLTGKEDPQYTYHNNVIADHIRAVSFMIADGIIPSNEGRGYVLRRIIRRALRHGYMMGMRDPFLYGLVDSVKKTMGGHYKEIEATESTIKQVLKNEEENFMKTIDKGMFILRDELDKVGSSEKFPADVAYKLYDTFGFPLDLTQDILRVENKKIDENEFAKIVNEQKEKSKKAWSGTGDSFTEKVWYDIKEKVRDIEFVRGVEALDSKVLYIVKDSEIVDSAKAGDHIFVVTEKTPFYAESGGQIGDTGFINKNVEVIDTQNIAGVVAHKCIVEDGTLTVGENVRLEISSLQRTNSSKNHTATHLLQKALRTILGDQVVQKGSLVTDERLRFDFIYNGKITQEIIKEVQGVVIDAIEEGMPVSTDIMSIEDARKTGALALFGEKYPEKVRVVSIGESYSKELCGGEHVSNTSKICNFKIFSLASIGSGLKRIEAITGSFVNSYFETELERSSNELELQRDKIKHLEKQINDLKTKNLAKESNMNSQKVGGVEFLHTMLSDCDQKTILGLVDLEKKYDDERCVVIFNKNSSSDTMSVCVFISNKLTSRMKAKDLVAFVKGSLNLDIKFGGRDNLVQLGGLKAAIFEEFLGAAKSYLEKIL